MIPTNTAGKRYTPFQRYFKGFHLNQACGLVKNPFSLCAIQFSHAITITTSTP